MWKFLKSDKEKGVKAGDGRLLKQVHWWEFMTRSVFYLQLNDDRYAVEVYFFRFEDNIMVYKNGRQVAMGAESMKYDVGDGLIEIALSDYGVKRMHYVSGAAQDEMLTPDKQSAEGLRYRFGKKFPRVSKWMGFTAIVVLLLSVVLWIPQIVELLAGWDILEPYIGGFQSPVNLSGWMNKTLVVLTVLAVTERALTIKYHWLIDMDTSSFED